MTDTLLLQKRMLEKNITLRQLAEKMQISPCTLRRQVCNIQPMKWQTAQFLVQALEIPPEERQAYFFEDSCKTQQNHS